MFPALAISYYANMKGLKVELGSDRLFGIPLDVYIPLEQVAIQVKAAIVTESQKAVEKREAVEKDKPTKSKNEIITEEAVRKPLQKRYDRSNRTDLE